MEALKRKRFKMETRKGLKKEMRNLLLEKMNIVFFFFKWGSFLYQSKPVRSDKY